MRLAESTQSGLEATPQHASGAIAALQDVLSKHSTLFHDEMGTLKTTNVTIHSQPIMHTLIFPPQASTI